MASRRSSRSFNAGNGLPQRTRRSAEGAEENGNGGESGKDNVAVVVTSEPAVLVFLVSWWLSAVVVTTAPERGKHSARSPAHGLVYGNCASRSQGGRESRSAATAAAAADTLGPLIRYIHLANGVPIIQKS
jgi:hypothetical protein